MSLREFPGLLRQLPHHKPWMIAIGVISSLVVLAACGFGTFQLLKDEAVPLGQPTDGATAHQRDLSTRAADSLPLDVVDVFPASEVVVEQGVPPYTMIGEPQVGTECGIAGDLEVRRLLEETDCTQILRATFNSYNNQYFVTAGVLNLLDLPSATSVSDQLTGLVDTDQGRLRGYISDPNVNSVMGRAPSRLAWQPRGHFLLYTVVVRKDGGDIAADASADAVVYDMLQRYLRDTVIMNWSLKPGPPPPEATGTADATPTATG